MPRLDSGDARSQSDLARQLGVTRQRVQQLLRLLGLAPGVQTFLLRTADADGRLSERKLQQLASLPDAAAQTQRLRAFLPRGLRFVDPRAVARQIRLES